MYNWQRINIGTWIFRSNHGLHFAFYFYEFLRKISWVSRVPWIIKIMFLAIFLCVYVCISLSLICVSYQPDSRINYCRMSKFGILMDYGIPIQYSYITLSFRDTNRAFFMNISRRTLLWSTGLTDSNQSSIRLHNSQVNPGVNKLVKKALIVC